MVGYIQATDSLPDTPPGNSLAASPGGVSPEYLHFKIFKAKECNGVESDSAHVKKDALQKEALMLLAMMTDEQIKAALAMLQKPDKMAG